MVGLAKARPSYVCGLHTPAHTCIIINSFKLMHSNCKFLYLFATYTYQNLTTYFKSKPTEEITFALDKVKQYSLAGCVPNVPPI